MATSEVLSVIATITSVKGNNSDFTSRVAAFKVLTKTATPSRKSSDASKRLKTRSVLSH